MKNQNPIEPQKVLLYLSFGLVSIGLVMLQNDPIVGMVIALTGAGVFVARMILNKML